MTAVRTIAVSAEARRDGSRRDRAGDQRVEVKRAEEKRAGENAAGSPSAQRGAIAPDAGAEKPLTLDTAASGRNPDQLRFRILQRGAWRRAIKLEEIFWTALETMAGRKATKLTDYIQSFLETKPSDANQTAELRVHAARWLHEQLTGTEEKLNDFGPRGMLQAVPLPGFIIGRGLGLVAFNAEFLYLIRRVAALEDGQDIPQARLNLDAPLGRIIDRLRETAPRPLECGFTLTIRRRASRGRVRVCIAPGPDGRDDIMGFVLTLRDDTSGASVEPSPGPLPGSLPAHRSR